MSQPGAPETAPRIGELPSELVNQIAAGEVIERPSSVVKELVENAIDAGATRLLVELEDGGRTLIRVTDDGYGIHPDDLPLAVRNHATSKIRALDDLFTIASLGFRGEALASIGSVSQFRLSSRRGEAEGAEIRVEGGKIEPIQPAGVPPGTRVEVRNLFFNVPARRKFLKSTRSEINAVTDQLTRLALSRTDIALTLTHDGKEILNVPPTDEPRERIARLTTSVIGEEILAVGPADGRRSEMHLRGYISPFHITRADSRGQYFFVNGRAVRDPILLGIVKQAYLHLLPPRRKPYAFLWLDLDPGDVDVNVHPTKSEVRFRYQSDVFALMLSALKEALAGSIEAPELTSTAPQPRVSSESAPRVEPSRLARSLGERTRELNFGPSPASPQPRSRDEGFVVRQAPGPSSSGSFSSGPVTSGTSAPGRPPACPSHRADAPDADAAGASALDRFRTAGGVSESAEPAATHEALPGLESAEHEGRRSAFGRYFQVHDSFIVEETAEGLKIIDQHALHERILYHEIVRRLAEGGIETQNLLFPVTAPIEPSMKVALEEVGPVLAELGFVATVNDKGELAVKAIPRFVKQEKALQTVLDLLGEEHPSFVDEEVIALDRAELQSRAFETPEARTLLHTFAASLACKAAVKFGMPLSSGEIETLLVKRHEVERAYCCPHGRPTTLAMGMGELRRRFGRPG